MVANLSAILAQALFLFTSMLQTWTSPCLMVTRIVHVYTLNTSKGRHTTAFTSCWRANTFLETNSGRQIHANNDKILQVLEEKYVICQNYTLSSPPFPMKGTSVTNLRACEPEPRAYFCEPLLFSYLFIYLFFFLFFAFSI